MDNDKSIPATSPTLAVPCLKGLLISRIIGYVLCIVGAVVFASPIAIQLATGEASGDVLMKGIGFGLLIAAFGFLMAGSKVKWLVSEGNEKKYISFDQYSERAAQQGILPPEHAQIIQRSQKQSHLHRILIVVVFLVTAGIMTIPSLVRGGDSPVQVSQGSPGSTTPENSYSYEVSGTIDYEITHYSLKNPAINLYAVTQVEAPGQTTVEILGEKPVTEELSVNQEDYEDYTLQIIPEADGITLLFKEPQEDGSTFTYSWKLGGDSDTISRWTKGETSLSPTQKSFDKYRADLLNDLPRMYRSITAETFNTTLGGKKFSPDNFQVEIKSLVLNMPSVTYIPAEQKPQVIVKNPEGMYLRAAVSLPAP